MTAKGPTQPADPAVAANATAPLLAVTPYYTAPDGSVYVHQDLTKRVEPWAVEAHVGPVRAVEAFGDVESWVAYVARFARVGDGEPFLTWNARGLSAVLDYHDSNGEPDRCQWTARQPFVLSIAWKAWTRLANGQPVAQKALVEALEDLAEDIVEPAAADVVHLLRSLRATVNHQAQTDLRADGTSSVSFSTDKKVSLPGLDLPPEITIQIPVLAGHVNADGAPVTYRLKVRVRVAVDDAAHLAFRLSIPAAERVLEDVYADRVASAKAQLGDGFTLLRAAEGGA